VADAAPKDGAASVEGAAPLISTLLQNRIIQALPALWPQSPVKPGDKWTAEVKWPLNDKPSTQAGADAGDKATNKTTQPSVTPGSGAEDAATPGLGKFNLSLVGEEEVDGRKLQRVTIDGTIEIDESKAAALAKLGEAPAAKAPPGRMLGTRQRVSGEMWLDSQAQHLTRLDLDLASQTALLSNAVGNTGKPGTWWFDFGGKLRMQLSRVSGATAAPDTANTAGAAGVAKAVEPVAPAAP
jgi:hypothetical protein